MMRLIEGGAPSRSPARRPAVHRVELILTTEQAIALGRLASQLSQGERVRLARPFPDEDTAASQAVKRLCTALRAIVAREIRSSFRVVEG